MSYNEMNRVLFIKTEGVPKMPETPEFEKYHAYVNRWHGDWTEYFYDQDLQINIGEDYVAFQLKIGDDYEGMAGLFFDVKSLMPSITDLRKLEKAGFKLDMTHTISALMIHHNGTDDYLIDLMNWDDIKELMNSQ